MISQQLRYFITFIRNDIKKRTEQEDYVEATTSDCARITLIIAIRKIFPDTIKDRDLRLGIIMALTGIPISSQNDLPAACTYSLIGALNDNLARDTTGSISRELQDAVERVHYFYPWKILEPGRADVGLSNLRKDNDHEYADGSSRGADLAVPGPEPPPQVSDLPSVQCSFETQ